MSTELNEALDQIDMEAYLDREGIDYKLTRGTRGAQLNIKECPVCGTSKWKVYINAETGLGNCFSGDCEAKFNRWSFIKAHLGAVTTRQVVEHCKEVAKEMGWRPAVKHSAPVQTDRPELRLPESYELPIDGRNLKYLDNRNITGEIAKYFHLRFCRTGAFQYVDTEGKRRAQPYDNRIIIPIYDLHGELVSFQGRDITGTADRKYLFPPGFASTGTHLYNGHNAVKAERIVIGEGVFDVMAIKIAMDGESALRDVVPVGSFGKHLSMGSDDSQMDKLMQLKERGLREVTFMWDGEKQATRDAVKAALEVRKMGLVARIAFLPKDKDPNEVAPSVVRKAFWTAEALTPLTAAKIKLKCLEG